MPPFLLVILKKDLKGAVEGVRPKPQTIQIIAKLEENKLLSI